jgi:hypothetical protein
MKAFPQAEQHSTSKCRHGVLSYGNVDFSLSPSHVLAHMGYHLCRFLILSSEIPSRSSPADYRRRLLSLPPFAFLCVERTIRKADPTKLTLPNAMYQSSRSWFVDILSRLLASILHRST